MIRNADMEDGSFNIFVTILSFIVHSVHDFQVIQPLNSTVNPSAWISCEHNAQVGSVQDVRLNAVFPDGKSQMLYQKGMTGCENISMHEENHNRYIFIMRNIGPEAMMVTYQCVFTVKQDDLDYTRTGAPTRLLPGQQETKEECVPTTLPPPPPPPPPLQLSWILIGLLALMFLYSCVITSIYIRLKKSTKHCENSTYVEMRKAPLPRNPH